MLGINLSDGHDGYDENAAANTLVEFSEWFSGKIASIINVDKYELEVSVDLAMTVQHANRSDIVLVPRGAYWAGGGGASGRSGRGHLGGRGCDLGFENMTKFPLIGTDEAASVAGECYVCSLLHPVSTA